MTICGVSRVNRKYLLSVSAIVFVIIVRVFYNFGKGNNDHIKTFNLRLVLPAKLSRNQTKTILVWNDSVERVEIISFGTGSSAFNVCNFNPYEQCELVNDRRKRPIESYDAIVINVPILKWSSLMKKRLNQSLKLRNRQQRQRVVFFSQESPVHTWSGKAVNPKHFNNFFNWTMTYRIDSDIPLFYGRIQRLQHSLLSPNIRNNNATNKTRLVAWMVSHCSTDSRREEYVEQLKRHIKVDVYGDCGNMKCPRSWDFSSANCYDMLESRYKFYLSFENAICRDYVTEKFFQALQRNIVPIVYGGADYSRIAPPHSYIDARLFEPIQLADYLLKLNANDSLYNEFFYWKEQYSVEAGLAQMARYGFCELCRKLHTDDKAKSYSNISDFWSLKGTCQHPPTQRKSEGTLQKVLGLKLIKSILN